MKTTETFCVAVFIASTLMLSHSTAWAHRDNYKLQQKSRSLAYPKDDFSPEAFCPDMGTTPHLKEIFMGRCWDYQFVLHRASCDVSNLKNCTELWELFQRAFVNRDPCNVTNDLYVPFSEAASQVVQVNKTLFWSGTYYLAHAYASENQKYVTLEDTFAGFVSQMLIWCGQVDDPGINYDSCLGPCWEQAQDAFWGRISADFARQARGVATVMLNGTRESGAFRNGSYFATYELPNLDSDKVTSVTVMVIHTLDVPKKESCGEGSLLTLENLLQKYGFPYTCIDDPDAVRHILCTENPEAHDCKVLRQSTCKASRTSAGMMSSVLALIIVFVLF